MRQQARVRNSTKKHNIGVKVRAMSNDLERRTQERSDIKRLVARYERGLDWNRIQEFYEAFDLQEEFRQLRERFDRAQ